MSNYSLTNTRKETEAQREAHSSSRILPIQSGIALHILYGRLNAKMGPMQQCFYEPCPMTPAVSTSPLTPKIQLPILEPFFKLRISLRVFIGLQLLVLWIWKMKKTHKRKGGMWKEGGRDRKGGIYCLNVLSKIFRPPA
jgi:hypothetical protein